MGKILKFEPRVKVESQPPQDEVETPMTVAFKEIRDEFTKEELDKMFDEDDDLDDVEGYVVEDTEKEDKDE